MGAKKICWRLPYKETIANKLVTNSAMNEILKVTIRIQVVLSMKGIAKAPSLFYTIVNVEKPRLAVF